MLLENANVNAKLKTLRDLKCIESDFYIHNHVRTVSSTIKQGVSSSWLLTSEAMGEIGIRDGVPGDELFML